MSPITKRLKTALNRNTGVWISVTIVFLLTFLTLTLDVRILAVSAIGLCLVQVFYCHPILLVSLWPIANLAGVFFPDFWLPVGPLFFLPMDPVYFFTIAHLGLWALRHPCSTLDVLRENRTLSLFLALVAFYICLSAPLYGHSALGEARKFYFMFLFPLLVLTSLRQPEDIRKLLVIVIGSAICVALYTVARAGLAGSIVRSVYSQAALIAALAGFAMVIQRMHRIVTFGPVLDRLSICLLFAIAVGTAHRSVWLALGAGFAVTLFFYHKRAAVMAKIVTLLVIGAFAASLAISVFPEMGTQLTKKFDGLMNPTSDGTASWRMEGWRQQLEALDGSEVFFGNGLGGYYKWRQDRYTTITASPHNAYIQLVLKFGLLGLLIYLLVVIEIFYKGISARKGLGQGSMRAYLEMGLVSLGAGHAYVFGYGFEPIILVFFAITAVTLKFLPNASTHLARAYQYRIPVSPEIPRSAGNPGSA